MQDKGKYRMYNLKLECAKAVDLDYFNRFREMTIF